MSLPPVCPLIVRRREDAPPWSCRRGPSPRSGRPDWWPCRRSRPRPRSIVANTSKKCMHPVWCHKKVSSAAKSRVDIRKEEIQVSCNKARRLDKGCAGTRLNECHGKHDEWKEFDRKRSKEEAHFLTTIFESSPVVGESEDKCLAEYHTTYEERIESLLPKHISHCTFSFFEWIGRLRNAIKIHDITNHNHGSAKYQEYKKVTWPWEFRPLATTPQQKKISTIYLSKLT